MKHPTGFTIVMLLLITTNVYGGINVLFQWQLFLGSYPKLTDGALSFILVVIAATIVGLAATWSWNRWGAVFVTLAYFMVLAFEFYFEINYHMYVATAGILLYWTAVWPIRQLLR